MLWTICAKTYGIFSTLREDRRPASLLAIDRGSWLSSAAGFGFRDVLGPFLDSFRPTFGMFAAWVAQQPLEVALESSKSTLGGP